MRSNYVIRCPSALQLKSPKAAQRLCSIFPIATKPWTSREVCSVPIELQKSAIRLSGWGCAVLGDI